MINADSAEFGRSGGGQINVIFRRNDSQRETADQYIVRVDHQLTQNNLLFGRFAASDGTTFAPGTFPGFGADFERAAAPAL